MGVLVDKQLPLNQQCVPGGKKAYSIPECMRKGTARRAVFPPRSQISAVRLPREPTNPERLKGFGYAEFEDIDSLFQALSLNEESLGNRRIRVDVADQAQDKDRDDRCFGRDRDRFRDSERLESDWRARPAAPDAFDDFPPRRGDDGFGDRYRDRYDDRYRDGPRRDLDRGFGSRDRYDDRSRDYDRGAANPSGNAETFPWGGGTFPWDHPFSTPFPGPTQRPKLNLKPRSAPKEEENSGIAAQSSRAASIFGGAKPVDTAAREREVEERLQKEQEKLQRQLEDDKRMDRRPRERHPAEGEREIPGKRAGGGRGEGGGAGLSAPPPPFPNSQIPGGEPKVIPAPPPKENAWMKRSQNPPTPIPGNSQGSDSERPGSPPSGGPSGPSPPGDDG
ncbi:PREDICTED: LOW QUALITY PROTEIN: eukaryotic translation initiation factor 4B, partial [Lepidothrix coronata]|uniref:LOW QUALITY PROTEIN: eukaryotic translation initiation factor 4B n=1 Tax=Lepidothrix coronata TaxID=321398 RepID=A0A6J0GI34_9PASS